MAGDDAFERTLKKAHPFSRQVAASGSDRDLHGSAGRPGEGLC